MTESCGLILDATPDSFIICKRILLSAVMAVQPLEGRVWIHLIECTPVPASRTLPQALVPWNLSIVLKRMSPMVVGIEVLDVAALLLLPPVKECITLMNVIIQAKCSRCV
jgi:hypothetical protein